MLSAHLPMVKSTAEITAPIQTYFQRTTASARYLYKAANRQVMTPIETINSTMWEIKLVLGIILWLRPETTELITRETNRRNATPSTRVIEKNRSLMVAMMPRLGRGAISHTSFIEV